MKKFALFTLLFIFLLFSGVGYYIYKDHKFYDLKIENRNINVKKNDIGIIGDSWVINKKLDKAVQNNLKQDSNIKSNGYYGFKSKELLQQNQSKDVLNVLEDENISKVVLIAGVNDTAGHIGKNYYSYHMIKWIELINSYGKKAYILEIPEYGIEEKENFKSALKHNLYRYIFDNGKVDVIESYRNQLEKDLVKKEDLKYQIIDFDSFIESYQDKKELYKDPYHLNDEGNERLGKHIAETLEN